jgi:RNA polymerase sigma-70 factor (ECF subfamily)
MTIPTTPPDEQMQPVPVEARGSAREHDDGAPDDLQVVTRVLAGEVALFELLMRRHNQRLFRAARAIVKDDDEAEDVMQEAYVNAYMNLAQFAGRARFASWLTRIAVHEALARVRKRGSVLREVEDEAMSSDRASPEQNASDRELRAILTPLVDALPDAFRVVFVLRAVEGLSVEETAECLDLLPETVRTRFFRARRLLRQGLIERGTQAEKCVYEFHLLRCDRVVGGVFARLGVL